MTWKEDNLGALVGKLQLGLTLRLASIAEIGPDDLVLMGAHHSAMGIFHRAANALKDFLKVERADVGPKNEQTDDEARVPNAVGDEGLVGRVGRAPTLIIEADQQIRANAHQLPAQKNLEKVIRQDQVEHRKTKEG